MEKLELYIIHAHIEERLVCRESEGNARAFRCFYHAWSFTNDGQLAGMPGRDGFLKTLIADGTKNMKEVKRLKVYRGFMFVNFDDNAISFDEYLGNAKEYFDLSLTNVK